MALINYMLNLNRLPMWNNCIWANYFLQLISTSLIQFVYTTVQHPHEHLTLLTQHLNVNLFHQSWGLSQLLKHTVLGVHKQHGLHLWPHQYNEKIDLLKLQITIHVPWKLRFELSLCSSMTYIYLFAKTYNLYAVSHNKN